MSSRASFCIQSSDSSAMFKTPNTHAALHEHLRVLRSSEGVERTSSFMMPDTKLIKWGTSKIMSAAVPACLISPLILKVRPVWAMSAMRFLGMKGLYVRISNVTLVVL